MAQDIVVRYRAEVDDLLRKLDQISDAQKEVIQGETKANDEAKKAATTQQFAATKRNQLLELEKKKLAELQKAQKLAFDPKQIDAYNKKIQESNKNIELLTDNTKKQTSVAGGALKSFALGAGAAIAAAFSVDAIIQFGKASIDAFLQAEKNAERLKFAITTIGGESEAAFERLIDQSEELQKITVFDDDSIQQAQAALAAFGLTADEIENIIPKLADFATVAGVDLNTAVSQLGAGLEGAGREFKKYGIEVSATASRQENLNTILQGFGKFAGAAEDATKTLSGQLQQANNQADDLRESIGEKLAPAFAKARLAVLNYIQALLLIPADEARKSTEKQREELQKQNIDFAIATTQRIQNLDKIAAAQQILADKENQLEQARSKNVNNVALRNKLKEEIDLINQIIQAEEERIRKEKEVSAIALANAERTLTTEQVRVKSTKELNQLLTENKKINDDIAQSNIKIIEDEIKVRQEVAKLRAKELADFEAFKRELDKGLDDLDKQLTETLAKLKPTDQDKLKFEIEFITATQGEDVAFTQVRDRLFAEFQAESIAIDAVATDTEEANLRKKISYENYINTLKALFPDLFATEQQNTEETAEVVTQTWVEKNAQILQSSSQLLSELSSLYSTFTNRQIEEINREKEARISAINESLRQNDDALAKRQISEQDAAANEKRLIEQQTRAEETAARKERELKRKQAIADKAAALVQIAINTATAISSAIGPQGVVLIPLYTALGAAQAAIVAAQPIPYAKGTKNAKEGLARVGEQGEEIMYVPQGTKVLPNRQTNRYGEVLDAMFDNRFEDYVNQRYIAPALMKEKQRRESNQQRSFAENIVQSAMINPQTGLTYTDMEQIRKKGTRLTDDTIERLADALTRRTPSQRFK